MSSGARRMLCIGRRGIGTRRREDAKRMCGPAGGAWAHRAVRFSGAAFGRAKNQGGTIGDSKAAGTSISSRLRVSACNSLLCRTRAVPRCLDKLLQPPGRTRRLSPQLDQGTTAEAVDQPRVAGAGEAGVRARSRALAAMEAAAAVAHRRLRAFMAGAGGGTAAGRGQEIARRIAVVEAAAAQVGGGRPRGMGHRRRRRGRVVPGT